MTFGQRWTRTEKEKEFVYRPLSSNEIYAGREVRYHGRRAIVLSIVEQKAPSGAVVFLARLRFPRGGEATVFAAQLEAGDG